MTKKSEDFSMQDAMHLANSDAGRQLFAYLQQQDGEAVREAMQQAAAGNYAQVKQTLNSLLQSPEAQKLLKQLGG